MTGVKDSTLQALRLKYNAALAAHQGCLRALLEAAMAGAPPAAAALESEDRARQALEQARERLLAAMTESITGEKPDVARLGPAASKLEDPPDAG
jgi:hypothetical protein